MKSNDDYFSDWESHVFGFGYGTGERHTIPCLQVFFELCKGKDGSYDYAQLEEELTPTVAWLLINTLCNANVIEYGTSPRYGWLTTNGRRLMDFVNSKSRSELIALANRDEEYTPCYPDYCNCGAEACRNPFWDKRRKSK